MSERGSGKLLLIASVVAVAVALACALWIAGSPAKERMRRMDRQRVGDLRELHQAVDHFWEQKEALPEDLEELTSWEGLDDPRTDPQSGKPYTYQPTGETDFRLCATFALERSQEHSPYGPGTRFDRWRHPAGQKCFELKVERDED